MSFCHRTSEGRVLAKVFSCAVVGLDGVLVEVEVDVGFGQPGMIVVGLPDKAVEESRERVRSAIRNSGGRVPQQKVTINLAPRKQGRHTTCQSLLPCLPPPARSARIWAMR
jgi:hypothetical protein